MYSEIFEEFVKIAQENDKAATESKPESPRLNAVKDLAEQYGIKPDTLDGMDYENNMAELAHPKPMVVSPAYDEPNGLIENVNERQSLIKEVVNRDPRGQHTNRRVMAKNELTLNLVRLGNELDISGDNDLTKLSDTCLNQMIEKKAFAFFPTLIGTVLSGMLLSKQLPSTNRGLVLNTEKLVSELQDIVRSNDNFGVGKKYKSSFIGFVNEVIRKLQAFKSLYSKGFSTYNELKLKSAKDILDNTTSIKNISDKNKKVLDFLKRSAEEMVLYSDRVSSLFNDDDFINDQVASSGALTSLLESTELVETITDAFNPADHVDDVRKALAAYSESLNNIISTINGGGDAEEKYTSYMDKMLAKYKKPSDKSLDKDKDKDIDLSGLANL